LALESRVIKLPEEEETMTNNVFHNDSVVV